MGCGASKNAKNAQNEAAASKEQPDTTNTAAVDPTKSVAVSDVGVCMFKSRNLIENDKKPSIRVNVFSWVQVIYKLIARLSWLDEFHLPLFLLKRNALVVSGKKKKGLVTTMTAPLCY